MKVQFTGGKVLQRFSWKKYGNGVGDMEEIDALKKESPSFEENKLTLEMVTDLWSKTYNNDKKPDWSHILPYYDDDIYFKDSIQEIQGIAEFKAMTVRLTKRSKDLKMKLIRTIQQENDIFIEWEMTIKYKKYPSSILYGISRLTISEKGKIREQRDYYDLWGDIFDNIPIFGKNYRKFLKKFFG